jgi:hypothetical protein
LRIWLEWVELIGIVCCLAAIAQHAIQEIGIARALVLPACAVTNIVAVTARQEINS